MQIIRETEDSRFYWEHNFRKVYELGEKSTREWVLTQGFDYRDKEFYAITLSPMESNIHHLGIWYNIDAKERLVGNLWSQVKHQLNRKLHNNYKRYPDKQIRDFFAIEHYDKKGKKQIKPHLHGTLAINKTMKEKFENIFDEKGDDFDLNIVHFNNNLRLKSVFVRHIPSLDDLHTWNGYVLKQQFEEN